MIPGQANFLQSLGWALLNSLWQMALLWVIYQVVAVIIKSTKSSFRSSLAFMFLATGFCMFLFTFISFYNNADPELSILPSSFQDSVKNQEPGFWIKQLLPIASVLYLIMLVLPVANFIRNYRYVQVIRQYGLSKINVQWRIFVNKVAARMGIKKPVNIWVSEFVSSPVTIGFLKPVILVPLAAINNLSEQQMEAVLLHELSHIRRHDYLINLVINIIKTILYFNPFVKAFVKIIEKEREKSCDEMVLQFQYDSYEYATALLFLEKTNLEYKPLVIGVAGKKNDLLKRVELIMGLKTRSPLSFNKLTGILAGLICMIAFHTLLFANKPKIETTTGFFARVSPAFNFLTRSNNVSAAKPFPEKKKSVVINKSTGEEVSEPGYDWYANNILVFPPDQRIINVNYRPVEGVQLKKYEEEQVKAAMDASKKVLENEEWKVVEKNIADVFTEKEKDELKATYKRELDKMDWNTWQNRLRLTYDKVDWNNVNEQLAKAIQKIHIDSLQNVYNEAVCKLDIAENELSGNNLKGIPDTGITLKTIAETKKQVQKILTRLKAVRNKKIVHL